MVCIALKSQRRLTVILKLILRTPVDLSLTGGLVVSVDHTELAAHAGVDVAEVVIVARRCGDVDELIDEGRIAAGIGGPKPLLNAMLPPPWVLPPVIGKFDGPKITFATPLPTAMSAPS